MRELIDLWWTAVTDFQALVATLADEEWGLPTDLPGWDVAAVVAHTAHLESTVIGVPHDGSILVQIGEPAHVTNLMGVFTEQGVLTRADRTRDELLEEIRTGTTQRYAELQAAEPVPEEPAPSAFGLIGWTNAALLKNRPFDVWMHEQDIRRAVGRPGGLDGPVCAYVTDYLLKSLGFVVGKKAGAATGQSVRLEVSGSAPVTVEVGEDGRGRPAEVADPTTTIRLDREAYVVLAGGRRTAAEVVAEVAGDRELGQRVLESLAVTP